MTCMYTEDASQRGGGNRMERTIFSEEGRLEKKKGVQIRSVLVLYAGILQKA
jgi:hypothetical protein